MNPEHQEPESNYAAHSTKLSAAANKLSQALRDNKRAEAKAIVQEAMRALCGINKFLNGEVK